MKEPLRIIADRLESKFDGVYIDIPSELPLPDNEGDIVIDAFNVPARLEEDFVVSFDRAKKEILWPKGIYNILFVPHTPEATEKYYCNRLPEFASVAELAFEKLPIERVVEQWSKDLKREIAFVFEELAVEPVVRWWMADLASEGVRVPNGEYCFIIQGKKFSCLVEAKWLSQPKTPVKSGFDETALEQIREAA